MNTASQPSNTPRMRRALRTLDRYVGRASNGLTLMAVHEADSLRGHLSALRERWTVARRARNTVELIRDQVDLLPESRNRVLRDHGVRRELWRGLLKDLGARMPQG